MAKGAIIWGRWPFQIFPSKEGDYSKEAINQGTATIWGNMVAWYKHERVGEFETVLQTWDEVEGLHNCWEFSQPLECLFQAMQTQKKKFSTAFIK